MPTATSILDAGLLNNGPLTTTFTAPASCSTAYNTGIAYADHLSYIDWSIDCKNHRPLDCDPPGPVITSVASAQEAGNPVADDIILYHSPGFDCPSGWTTAGAATKINPTSSIVSGAFSVNISAAMPSGFPYFQDTWQDELASALDPSETAFVCCPNSFTWGIGGCYSTLPSVTPSVGCQRIVPNTDIGMATGPWTIAGKTFTQDQIIITGTATEIVTTTTFKHSQATSLAAVAIGNPVVLVHKASDKTGAAVRAGGSASGFGVLATAYCAVLALGALLAM